MTPRFVGLPAVNADIPTSIADLPWGPEQLASHQPTPSVSPKTLNRGLMVETTSAPPIQFGRGPLAARLRSIDCLIAIGDLLVLRTDEAGRHCRSAPTGSPLEIFFSHVKGVICPPSPSKRPRTAPVRPSLGESSRTASRRLVETSDLRLPGCPYLELDTLAAA